MSRTLFWYVFRDLVRISLMASGVLAGIMSFGGLLRPLTEHGLSALQVGTLLRDFQPAMTAYSFPIAALFAATMVYGRLSSDNELSACRACGISYLSLAAPAAVLGLVVALISLWMLCFIVPVYNLKIEQVLYENMAQLVQNQIERTHQMELGDIVISASEAQVLDADPSRPGEQRVHLTAPMFISYTTEIEPELNNLRVRVPREYWTATSAIAYIKPMGEKVVITAHAEKGVKFTHVVQNQASETANVEDVNYGPIEMDSPIREQPKFKDITELHDLIANPQKSKRLQDHMAVAISREERMMLFQQIVDALNDPARGTYDFVDLNTEGTRLISLVRGEAPAVMPTEGDELVLDSSKAKVSGGGSSSVAHHVDRQVKILQRDKPDEEPIEKQAVQFRIRATPDVVAPGQVETTPERRISLKVTGYDESVETDDAPADHRKLDESYSIRTPDDIRACEAHTAEFYMETHPAYFSGAQREALTTEYRRLIGKLYGEVHSRSAFAVSCVVLVLIGCALGMMFRSGNVLTAFAVSFVPALMGIALIITGQQLAATSKELTLGLSIIWSGNAMVLILAVWLLGRLQRT